MAVKTRKLAGWKGFLAALFLWSLFSTILVLFLPLFYLAFASITLVAPPLAYLHELHDKFAAKTRFSFVEELRRLVSYLVFFPLVLLSVTAVLRSLTLFVFSLYPPALSVFQQFHYDNVYHFFIPAYGALFPYWLDVYWGTTAVIVFLGMGILGAWNRSVLIRQINLLPTSRVQSAAIGLVELKGRAHPLDPEQETPIIHQWIDTSGEGISLPSYAQPFHLDDGSGRVLIDPRGCNIDQSDSMFAIGIHQVILRQRRDPAGFTEGRLMPGDPVYVLGNLQINEDPAFSDDPVVVKAQKSSLIQPRFNDVFFVTDKSKDVLLDAFQRVSRMGWLRSFGLFLVAGWIAIYAWTNLTQITAQRLDAAPAVFRLLSPATDLERKIEIEDIGSRPAIAWLDAIAAGDTETDQIMHALDKRMLAHLAVPALTRLATDIDSAGFAEANHWLNKLGRVPSSHWAYQYFRDEHVLDNIARDNNTEAFVYRVMLDYEAPVLRASWKAWVSDFESKHLTLVDKRLLFRLTDSNTGQQYLRELPLEFGWNRVKNERLFENLPPGSYQFDCHVSRRYQGGARDRGSRSRSKIEILLQ